MEDLDTAAQQDLWNKRWGDTWGDHERNPFAVDCFERYIRQRALHRVLDLGCGDGPDTLFFAHQGMTVTAVDFSNSALVGVERRVDNQYPSGTVETHQGALDELRFPAAMFDVIYSHLGLQFLNNMGTEELFKRMKEWLRDEGLVALKMKSIFDPMYGQGEEIDDDVFSLDGQIRHFFNPEKIESLMCGMRILNLESTTEPYPGYDFDQGFVQVVATKAKVCEATR